METQRAYGNPRRSSLAFHGLEGAQEMRVPKGTLPTAGASAAADTLALRAWGPRREMLMPSAVRMLCGAALVVGLSAATAAQAAVLFQVDNTEGTKLFLTKATDTASSTGTVINPDDVTIGVTGNSDFADGFSTIKPIKGGTLTDLLFTPVNGNAFSGFTFRGQDAVKDQSIELIVTDNQGDAPEDFFFNVAKANADFGPLGIDAINPAVNTIMSIELINSPGGFNEAKQFTFTGAVGIGTHGTVPEPATWATMLLGIALVGGGIRFARRQVEGGLAGA